MSTPSQVRFSRMYRLIVSALVAGGIIGLTAAQGGVATKTAVLLGVIAALKDVQAYLSSAPGAPQHPQVQETTPQEPAEP